MLDEFSALSDEGEFSLHWGKPRQGGKSQSCVGYTQVDPSFFSDPPGFLMALDRVIFLSRSQACAMQPLRGFIIISIHDAKESPAPLKPDWSARLTLTFEDTSNPGSGLRCFDRAMAAQVLDFVQEHRGSQRELYVHCRMGVSRSAALALALSEIHGLRCFKHGLGPVQTAHWSHYNPFVYRTLHDEHLEREDASQS